ncbi:hypothetical protein HGRIS_000129 [Hohenbuehelia grisea]|uniref:Serine-threonine/tyrosine-protein kinase catalytic domain-containing protein n=1 Tax=Hohenbuehelia grisea TaxID=104357 RepID=A0ABR3JQ47_9AGAR
MSTLVKPYDQLDNKLNNFRRVFQLLKDVGEVSVLSPMKPICGLVLLILDTTQELRRLKGDYDNLAQRVTSLADVISKYIRVDRAVLPDLEHRLNALLGALRYINSEATELAKLKWPQAILRSQELKDRLSRYHNQLDDAINTFSVTTLADLQERQASMERKIGMETDRIIHAMSTRTDELDAVLQAARQDILLGLSCILAKFDIANPGDMDTGIEHPVFRPEHVTLERKLQSGLSSGYLCRGTIKGPPPIVNVVVKVFYPDSAGRRDFKKEIRRLKGFNHPNCHRFLGASASTSTAPFIIMSDFAHNRVRPYLDRKLCANQVESFMSTLYVLQGLASGMEYLQHLHSFTKNEIEECVQTTNLALTSEGRVVIGHNLVRSNLQEPPSMDEMAIPGLQKWLRVLFWNRLVELTYGPDSPHRSNYSEWNSILARGRPGQPSTSHLRLLETFACYAVVRIEDVTRHLDALLEALDSSYKEGTLTFPDIRQASMALRSPQYLYRPNDVLPAMVGDLGYMDDRGNFHLLTNVQSKAHFEISTEDMSGITSDGCFEEGKSDGSGILRHRFIGILFALIRRQATTSMIADTGHAWRFLLEHAVSFRNAFTTPDCLLQIKDLILIVGIQRDLRVAILDRRAPEWDVSPRRSANDIVEFVEYETYSPDSPWGYWVMENGDGASMRGHRCSQNILFIQLENEDVQSTVIPTELKCSEMYHR